MNKLITIAFAVLALAFAAKAETYSSSIATGTNILKGEQSVYVQSVQFANGTGSAVTVALFDAPTNALTYAVGAYTNYITYVSNVVSTVVGFNGSTNSFTNSTLMRVANPVAAATNSYRTITRVTVPANDTLTVPIASTAAFGVLATNNGTITVTMSYQRLR